MQKKVPPESQSPFQPSADLAAKILTEVVSCVSRPGAHAVFLPLVFLPLVGAAPAAGQTQEETLRVIPK